MLDDLGAIPIRLTHNGQEHHAILLPNLGVRLQDSHPEAWLPDGEAYFPGAAARIITGKHPRPFRVWEYYDESSGKWRPIDDLPNIEALKDRMDDHARYDPARKRWIIHS